jgi:hypothetical protein
MKNGNSPYTRGAWYMVHERKRGTEAIWAGGRSTFEPEECANKSRRLDWLLPFRQREHDHRVLLQELHVLQVPLMRLYVLWGFVVRNKGGGRRGCNRGAARGGSVCRCKDGSRIDGDYACTPISDRSV